MSSTPYSSALPADALVAPMDFEDTGRGLGCIRDVAEGEDLVVIPLETCWWAGGSRKEPDLRPLIDGGVELTDLDACALHLLIERAKGSASSRWAHLQDLPVGYDSTLFWTDEEMARLEGSDWKGLAERFSGEAKSDWEALQATLTAGAETGGAATFLARHGIDWEGYLWAYATLKSRQAEAQVDGKMARLMAPGFDLFNHSDALIPGTTHYFDTKRSALCCRATHAHAKGEQVVLSVESVTRSVRRVCSGHQPPKAHASTRWAAAHARPSHGQAFISYGTASNGSLLLGGGFVLESNKFDFVE